MSDLTDDAFLSGAIILRQPTKGFRAGLDAVMLAAAVSARDGQSCLELGAGVGTASLCLAARVKGCHIDAVEIEPDLAALAQDNAKTNGMESRVQFHQANILALPRELARGFDHVFCNPPFHDAEGQASPDTQRAQALQDLGDLPRWLETGLRRTGPKGIFSAILRTDRLAQALSVLPGTGVRVFPLWPRRNEPSKRVIVQVRRGGRTPFVLLPGLVLHQDDGRYTPEADAVLRGEALDLNSRA